jgi:hypothetical protein
MSEVRVVQRRRSRIEVKKLVAEFEASGCGGMRSARAGLVGIGLG